MSTFRSIVFASVIAGFIVGLIVTVVQQFGTVPLILKAEVFEKAAERTSMVPQPHRSRRLPGMTTQTTIMAPAATTMAPGPGSRAMVLSATPILRPPIS